ncbi:DUF4279 domain-containing protein [Coleofasciculus sp. H7-2]|uniref:DUF4279 domain-containing protein n=1 Tax=Coleofasciculus sp. H7-2 TaxID=3351545 RepID=UPI00366AD043
MEYEISAAFTLTGFDFNPEEITAKVGIIPTKIWKVGDLIHPKAGIRRKRNGWSLESKLEKSAELEDHIKSVLEQIQPGWLPMVEISSRYEAEIDCVVYVRGQVPAIHFDKDIVEQAAKLNAEIDVDLYVLPVDPPAL